MIYKFSLFKIHRILDLLRDILSTWNATFLGTEHFAAEHF